MPDSFGRNIDYLRVSITDRCNLRCVYCMPENGVEKLPRDGILSYEELLRCCRIFARLGVRRVRVTGGEPLVRADVVSFIRELKRIEGIEFVTLTTNGILLSEFTRGLKGAGLDSVNVSLDSLDANAYRRITRTGGVSRALDGINAALDAGIPSVKVNCVPIAGMRGQDAARVALLAKDRNIHVRFIEMMPVGAGAYFDRVDNRRLQALIEEEYGPLTSCEEILGGGPARYFTLSGFKGKIGFISSADECICGSCNRVRLTCDGFVKPCLRRGDSVSLLNALEQQDDEQLEREIQQAIWLKPERHGHGMGASAEYRVMSQIGG